MKQLAYFSGTIFTSITLLAILFKSMHWPGAGVGLLLGFAGLALVAVPAIAIYKYRKV